MVIELSFEFFMKWMEWSKGGGLHIGISFVAARWAIQRKWVYSSLIYVVTSQQYKYKYKYGGGGGGGLWSQILTFGQRKMLSRNCKLQIAKIAMKYLSKGVKLKKLRDSNLTLNLRQAQ